METIHACYVTLNGGVYRISAGLSFGTRPDKSLPAHNHSQYELHAVCGGSCEMLFEGSRLVLKDGDCCVIRPHVYHIRKPEPDVVKCYDLRIDCPANAMLDTRGQDAVVLRCSPRLMGYFAALENELNNRPIGADSAIESFCTLIAVALIRELTTITDTFPVRTGSGTEFRDQVIDNYFAMHYADDANAAALAGVLGITTRQLARIMQRLYGCTFRQRLLETRLYHAHHLLTAGRLPVWQIAAECGFSSVGAFSGAFRAATGCTPSQYRMQNRR